MIVLRAIGKRIVMQIILINEALSIILFLQEDIANQNNVEYIGSLNTLSKQSG